MKTFIARCTLRNGERRVLTVIAATSCDAVITALDTFGLLLRTCSVTPA